MKNKYYSNPKILNDFLNYLLAIKGYSIRTIEEYESVLIMFFKFIKEYLSIAIEIKDFNVFILLQVKEADIIAFLVHTNFKHDNSPYTRQKKLSAIRSFYKWLLSTYPSMLKENPAKEIPNIEKVVRIPKYLTLEQSKKIQEVFTLKNSKFPLRNNLIISLFLTTGLRASELININLEDINFSNNTIRINKGKGNKEREIVFSNKYKERLLDYIALRNKKNKVVKLSEPLFISYQNKRIGIDGIEDICKKAYELMGLEKCGYTTHTLRHTAASLMYIYVKQDILLLKEFLGHSSINTTQIYTHICNEKVKEAVEKNPLNIVENAKEEAA